MRNLLDRLAGKEVALKGGMSDRVGAPPCYSRGVAGICTVSKALQRTFKDSRRRALTSGPLSKGALVLVMSESGQ